MDWRLIAFTAPVFFVAYQSLSKLLPKGISVFLVTAYASLVGFVVMLILHLLTQSDKSVNLPAKAMWLVLSMGLFISMGNLGIIKAFSLGAPQSTFTLFFYVTLIVYGTIFGLLFWRERLEFIQLIGFAFALLGIFILVYFKKSA